MKHRSLTIAVRFRSRANFTSTRTGLTLVEMAIVLLVLGILMGIVFYNLRSSEPTTKAAIALKFRTDAKLLKAHLPQYLRECPDLPDGSDLRPLAEKHSECPGWAPLDEEAILDYWKAPYFVKVDETGARHVCTYGKDKQAGGDNESSDFCITDSKQWPAWLK